MEDIKKIVVIDKDEEMGIKLKEIFGNWEGEKLDIKWFSALVIEEIRGAHCVIIDSRLIKDVKNFIEVLKALSVKKIILATDELNHPGSPIATSMGAMVYYRYSPTTTLIYKVFDSYKPKENLLYVEDKKKDKLTNKLVAIYSPKGGTGKTTLSINLAAQLSQKNSRVLLVDLSTFGNVAVKLKITENTNGIEKILRNLDKTKINKEELRDVVVSNIYSYTSGAIKFDVLTAAPPIKMENLKVGALEKIIDLIKNLDYDVVLIDTHSDLSNKNLSLFEMVDNIIIVAVPDINSTWNLIQTKTTLNSLGVEEKCKLVMNMHSEDVDFSLGEVETELQYELLSNIPFYKKIKSIENKGSIMALQGNDDINVHYKQVANGILPIFESEELEVSKKGFFSSLGIIKKK